MCVMKITFVRPKNTMPYCANGAKICDVQT